MNDSIYIYNINNDIAMDKINKLTNQINDLKTTNKYFQRIQSALINTNKNLSEQR
jgi:hypothetical protein